MRVHHAESDVRLGLRTVECQGAIRRRLDTTAEIGWGCAVVVGQIFERLREPAYAREIRILVDRFLKQVRRFGYGPARQDEKACAHVVVVRFGVRRPLVATLSWHRQDGGTLTRCAVRDAGRAPP
jgi:hypothetical protein